MSTVAFLGPDGSGKSTAIKLVGELLRKRGYTVISYHLRAGFFRRQNRENIHPNECPHAKRAYGWLLSIIKLLWLLFEYTVDYLLLVRPKTRRGEIVIFDRYYHDILVDPKRYRVGVPEKIIRFIGRFVPYPNIIIVLDIDPVVVRARKVEVELSESIRQHDAYRKFSVSTPNAILVSADTLPEKIALNCLEIITNTEPVLKV